MLRSFPWLFLTLLLVPRLAHGQGYKGNPCHLSNKPIVLLAKSAVTGSNFTIVKRLSADSTEFEEGQFRFLEETDYHDFTQESLRSGILSVPGLLVYQDTETRHLQEDTDIFEGNVSLSSSEFYYARECDCFGAQVQTAYCPFTTSSCQAPWGYINQIPRCVSDPKGRKRTERLFLGIIIWFAVLFLSVFCTDSGRNSIHYMLSCCIPGWNISVATRMLRRHPDKALGLIRNNLFRRRQMLERRADHAQAEAEAEAETVVAARALPRQEEGAAPTSLALRTRIYKGDPRRRGSFRSVKEEESSAALRMSFSALSHSEHCGPDEEDDNCTICFATLLDGDRVGALTCDHIFHAECLKVWLQRRNVCPLCQAKDAATPRFEKDPSSTEVEDPSSPANETSSPSGGNEEEPSSENP